jgi:hypothetical protein
MNFCPKYLQFGLTLITTLAFATATAQNRPLIHGYAHNDYFHKRPLYEALENGYTFIEADIYLRHEQLIVAHVMPVLRQHRTLERLYLAPLLKYIKDTNNKTACSGCTLTLMIDIKSESDRTYRALAILLEKYREVLSEYNDGRFIQRPLTIVLTGHKPIKLLKARQSRLVFVDEDLTTVQNDTMATNLYLTASCKYSHLLQWTGRGIFPSRERSLLCRYVTMAHRFGKKVRLWASPENPVVWNALLDCGVDLINTDRLTDLKDFLNHRQALSDAISYTERN